MEKDWEFIKSSIEAILNSVSHKLERSLIEQVLHYIEHDEFEMAFEILFIELMNTKHLPLLDYKKSRQIGELLELDKETIFDPSFWEKFIDFTSIRNT
jgi:hypothetical protein